MNEQNYPDNSLYELDNLDVLRGMNSETVDLIATDPPFNTKRNRSATAGFYVDNWKWGDTGLLPDQWKWNEVHPQWLEVVKDSNAALFEVIECARVCYNDGIAAFLCFLSVRLLEMHRLLKPTGSIYLHCDSTASHYIKMAMDAIFGQKHFRNEIVWRRHTGNNNAKRYANVTDSLLYYIKSPGAKWNQQYGPLSENKRKEYNRSDPDGRLWTTNDLTAPNSDRMFVWRGTRPTTRGWAYSYEELETLWHEGRILTDDQGRPLKRGKKMYLDESKGVPMKNLWTDISRIGNSSAERVRSPDQKPVELYERVIEASSDKGDLVLDPFCGCATTIIAAHNLQRRWVGIDRRVDARYHVVCRLAGITADKREWYAKQDASWLNRQLTKYEAHYHSQSPVRTDEGSTAAPKLGPVYPVIDQTTFRHAEMLEILVDKFGLQCWGCTFIAPDYRYLELDHIDPRSSGGSNELDNRALLCRPCNQKKSNKLTLDGLWRENRREGHLAARQKPIDIHYAREWARQYLKTCNRAPASQLSFLDTSNH